jgi:hypothetical protein
MPPRGGSRKPNGGEEISYALLAARTERLAHLEFGLYTQCMRRPPTRGPSPQSSWSHIPGSGIHSRCVRRCPALHATFTSAPPVGSSGQSRKTPSPPTDNAPHPRGSDPGSSSPTPQLDQKPIDRPNPPDSHQRIPTSIADRDIADHCLFIHLGELRGRVHTTGQAKRFKTSMISLSDLRSALIRNRSQPSRRDPAPTFGTQAYPGSYVHKPGEFMSTEPD